MPRDDRIVVEGLGRLPVFSHAASAGELLFVSGTLGTLPGVLEIAGGGAGPETAQTLRNVQAILEAAGASLRDVVKVSVYLRDMADFAAMNEAYASFFPEDPPARITLGGAELALGARVEIECVAQRPGPDALVEVPPAAGAEPTAETPVRRSGFLASGGEQLYWESVGEGPPLVLCHGAGGNHAVWYQQVPFFARRRRVVTWDHRGFGRSSDLAEVSGPDVAVADLRALLDHLGIERTDLVGQSMGGWTALGFALAEPERVRRLVLADTPGGIPVAELARLREAARQGAGLAAPERMGHHPALDVSLAARDPARAYLYQLLGGFGEPDLPRIARKLLSVEVDPERLARLRAPVLFVVGARDPLFPPAAIRAAAARLPGARVVEIAGAGHSPYFELPEAWNAAVAEFLEG